MSGHKVRLAALSARTRRMLRHTADPVERALAMVIVARAIADRAATNAAQNRDGEAAELASAERVLTAALEHLHRVRHGSYQQEPLAGHE